MTIIQQNFLQPIEFQFQIKRLPSVAFFVQQANIPGMTMQPVGQPNMFRTIWHSGDRLEYDTFEIVVRVDEDMNNYLEIMNWMVGLTKPAEFAQRANLVAGDGLYSDASLFIMSNSKNPNIEIRMQDIFPISLGAVQMDTTSTDVIYPTTSITFRTNGVEIIKI